VPSKSDKQRKFMRAAANNPKFAKKAGIPQSVAREYAEADKMKDKKMYAKGGMSSCGTKKMRKGGKVRGCGMAKKGVRPAKMM
jgi:hypothetical protein